MLRENLLTILTVAGVVLGLVVGLIIRASTDTKFTEREVSYIYFLGDIFLRLLKLLILPLIMSSLVSAVGSLDLSLSGKIGGRAVAYYLLTTVLAVILGIILVVSIQPGNRIGDKDVEADSSKGRNITITDTLLDLVRNMVPPNVVQACIQQYQSVLVMPEDNPTAALTDWHIKGEFIDQMNILGLVVISIAFGIALSSTRSESQGIIRLVREFNYVIMKITGWVIWLSPVGIIFLIVSKMLEIDSLSEMFGSLGLYFVTVAGGISFHGFVILPLIYFLLTRNNPYKFIGHMGKAMATAFGTSSSSATLPVTMQCLEENAKVDPRVSKFVLPIGATINMDGTALYEAVAAIFIAQLRGRALGFGNIIAISITATAASIGAAGIPQAGLVTLVMVLDTIGLPAEDVSLILAVDWLLDRFRTLVNVLGDSFGASIVEHFSSAELQATERHNDTNGMNKVPTLESVQTTMTLDDSKM